MGVLEQMKEQSDLVDWLMGEVGPVDPVEKLTPKMQAIVKYLRDINGRGLNQWRVVYAQIAAVILDDDPDLAGKLCMIPDEEDDRKLKWPRVARVIDNTNSHNYRKGSIVVHWPSGLKPVADYWLKPDGDTGNHLRLSDVSKKVKREDLEEFVATRPPEWWENMRKIWKEG